MEVTPHLIHQEKERSIQERDAKIIAYLGGKDKEDRGAFQLCRQHCNARDTESCDMGSSPVTALAGRARVLWQSYFSPE